MSDKRDSEKSTETQETGTCSRRQFLKGGTAAAAISTTLRTRAGHASNREADSDLNLFFGDTHCHSNWSDGNGAPEDLFDTARSHLDFWALTDHAFDDIVFSLDYRKYGDGKRVDEEWPTLQKLCRSHEKDGRFIPFLAYEWTNFQYGHHNVYYLDYDQPIRMPATLPKLYAALKNVDAMVIPHHTGYPLNICGKNWDYHDERLSPYVEVYSTHGSSETSEGVRPILTLGSWMGPGAGEGSVQAGLARGHKLGIVASTDSHLNHPGAYDLGLMAVYAEELSRKSLWKSFHQRRVYGVTGDRIQLDFSINGSPMGSTVKTAGPRLLRVSAVAWDQIERVEILKNNEIFQAFTNPQGPPSSQEKKRHRFLVEWGWDARKEHDWKATLALGKGTILQAIPCFRGSMEGRKGTGIQSRSSSRCEWTSRTEKARYDNQARRYSDVMAFEVECPDREEINLVVTCDALRQELKMTPGDLSSKSTVQYMENIPPTNDGNFWRNIDFCSKFKVHQARQTSQLTVDLSCEDKDGNKTPGGTDFYYVRLIQRNGQRAWSSPIWVEAV